MNPDDLKNVVAGVLGVAPLRLTADAGPETLETWDSLAHLTIVTAVEEHFGIQFRMDEIRSIDCFGELEQLVRARLAK
jgi:acyl carrier protein